MYYVYLLRSQSKVAQLYIGYTKNLKKRFKRHNNGLVISTKPYRPWKLLFYEAYVNNVDAQRREQYLKTTKGKRGLKLMLNYTLKE